MKDPVFVDWACRSCDGEGYCGIGTAFEKKCGACRGTGSERVAKVLRERRTRFGFETTSDEQKAIEKEFPPRK